MSTVMHLATAGATTAALLLSPAPVEPTQGRSRSHVIVPMSGKAGGFTSASANTGGVSMAARTNATTHPVDEVDWDAAYAGWDEESLDWAESTFAAVSEAWESTERA